MDANGQPTYEEFDKAMSEMPQEVYDTVFVIVMKNEYSDADMRAALAGQYEEYVKETAPDIVDTLTDLLKGEA